MPPSAAMKTWIIQILMLIAILPENQDCLIITSVIAGDKKFKTISFDTKLLKPLTFEKEMPLTEFRRHRTMRPPKFDIDVNIPIKLPMEDEYAKEESTKPVESNIFFQSGDIIEPSYGKKPMRYPYQKSTAYQEQIPYSDSTNHYRWMPNSNQRKYDNPSELNDRLYPSRNPKMAPIISSRSDAKEKSSHQQETMMQAASEPGYHNKGYANQYNEDDSPNFVPGGFVNLQLSGPTGGPKQTHEDYDREKWAQQLSQAPGAMPYPILNYQQLQNFYGGLGTFTNGLADVRYEPVGLLEKIKSGIDHFTSKFNQILTH